MNKYLIENDFTDDCLRWEAKLEEFFPNFNRFQISHLKHNDIDKLQQFIINTNDFAFAYFFANDFNYKSFLMQKVILDSKNPKYAFLFAQNIQNCDIKALQNIVLESNNLKYICKFGCFIDGADVKVIENLLLHSKNIKYCYSLFKYNKNINLEQFKTIILNSKKPKYLFELAKKLRSRDEIINIQNILIELKSFTYLRLFAEKIQYADIEKIEQFILDSDNTEEIKKFAIYVKRSKMKNFLLIL